MLQLHLVGRRVRRDLVFKSLLKIDGTPDIRSKQRAGNQFVLVRQTRPSDGVALFQRHDARDVVLFERRGKAFEPAFDGTRARSHFYRGLHVQEFRDLAGGGKRAMERTTNLATVLDVQNALVGLAPLQDGDLLIADSYKLLELLHLLRKQSHTGRKLGNHLVFFFVIGMVLVCLCHRSSCRRPSLELLLAIGRIMDRAASSPLQLSDLGLQ